MKIAKKFDVREIPINDLIASDYNPRRLTEKQHQDLVQSFKSLGALEPAVVNTYPGRENVIIGGHQRIKVAKELGYKTYPCHEVSFTLEKEKEKEANIRLNKNRGEFDMDLLVQGFSETELVEWGFDLADFFKAAATPDYSVLDGSNDSLLEDMANGVKKALQIEFEPADYEEAVALVKFWRDNDFYIGGAFLERLREAKP